METFRDIINAWPSPAEFAEDAGIDAGHARTMRTRNSIPSEYWELLVNGAKRRRIPAITLSLFHAVKRSRRARATGASDRSTVRATIPANPSQSKAIQP